MPQVPHAIAVERIRLIPVMTPGANLGRVLVIIFRIFGGSGVIPWQSYPKMIDKRYMKNGRSDTPCS